jgi:methylase of polypeptide subunit release factors
VGRGRQYNDAVPLDAGVPQLEEVVRALGARLRDLGYEGASQHPRDMLRHWRAGVPEYDAARIADLDGQPVGVAVRAFELRRPVLRPELEAALPGVDLDVLLAAGILRAEGESVRAVVGIQACDGVFALADDEYAEFDAVLRVSGSSLALASLTPHRAGGRLLDLGTGGGFQALLAARRGMHAVGVDIGERAVALAGWASALSGIDEVDWRLGDWFDPVAGERFDVVVANPPFVISSRSEFLFRDSGGPPGELARSLVRRAPGSLAPGGIAVLAAEWLVPTGVPWSEPPREWVDGLGCDVVALRFASATPEEHAAGWLAGVPAEAMVERRAEWVQNIRGHGGEAVVYGTLVLRPVEGRAGAFGPVACGGPPAAPAGEWVLALLDAVAAEATAGGGDHAAGRYEVADGVRVDQPFARSGGRWKAGRSRLRPRGAMPVAVQVRPGVLDVLLALDGVAPLADVVADVARRRGHDRDELATAVTDVLPELLRTALVRRAPTGTGAPVPGAVV